MARKKKYILAMLLFLAVVGGIFAIVLGSMPWISGYKGDGVISIVKAPPLGRTGAKVDFQEFILDGSYTATLNLSGLPFDFDRPSYNLYLVVPQRYSWERKVKGNCSVELLSDGKVIASAKSKIEDMIRTGAFEETEFYFKDFRIPYGYSDLSLKVEANGTNPGGANIAFFRVQYGGTK